jgi:autotransporter-associated beta strand protein
MVGSQQQQRKQSRRALVLTAAASAALAGVTSVEADLTHRYSFSEAGGTVVTDSVGGANGTFVIKTAGPNAVIGNGRLSLGNPGNNNNVTQGNYVDLPNNIAKTSDLTIEGWVTYNGGGNDWQRIFDFGSTTTGEHTPESTATGYEGLNYLFVTPKAGGGNYRGELNLGPANGRVGQLVDRAPAATFPAGGDQHFALTKSGSTMSLYLNGVLVGQNENATNDAALTDQVNVWLGRSNWQGDAFFNGAYNEFRIYDDARTAAQIAASFGYGPDNLGPAGVNVWQTPGSGNFATVGGWSQNRVPNATDQAVIDNGATVTVNSNVGANNTTTLNNGTLTFTGAGAALTAIIDLAPGNGPGAATVNLNGGTLTAPRVIVDTGVAGGTGAKAINFNGGALALTETSTVAGVNLTTTVGAAGGTIGVSANNTVTWAPVLTAAGPAVVLTKVGGGALTLGGGYAGSLAVRGGTLSNPAELTGGAGTTILIGDAAAAGGASAALVLTGTTAATVVAPVTAGTPAGGGASALRVGGNNTVTFTGPVTLNQNLAVGNVGTTGTNNTTFTGGFAAGAAGAKVLTFDNAGTVNVTTAGISDGAGQVSVAKTGGGTVFLQAPNTYTGTTTVNGGGVVFAAPNTIGGAGRSVTVNAGGVAVAGPGFAAGTINSAFLTRIDAASSGVLALSADSAENFDFSPGGQNLPAAFLGAATNVTVTGTLTPGGGAYRLGGGGGTLTIPGNGALSGANGLFVGGPGGGGVTIGGANPTLTGPLTISGNTVLTVPSIGAVGTPTALSMAGTLRVTGGPDFALPSPVTLTGPGTLDHVPNVALDSLVVTPTNQNGATLTKTGPGTLTVTGNVQLGNNSFWMKQGTVSIGGTAVVNSTFFNAIGQSGADNATLIVRDGAQYSVAHDLNVGDVDNARGALYIRDNAVVRATTFYAGKFNNTQGVVVQTGGALTDVNNAGGEWRIGGTDAAAAASVGAYDLSAGTLTTNRNLQVGAFGSGSLRVTGGTASGGGYSAVGRFTGGYGVLSVSGTGGFTHTGPANNLMIVGEQGVGIVNVSGGGTFTAQNAPIHLGLAQVGSGFVNLGAGGTVTAPRVTAGPGQAMFNFHGGTLVPSADTAEGGSFILGPVAFVWSEGGAIDTNGRNVALVQPLSAPYGDGVVTIPVVNGGSGYVAHPVVKITGGGGLGASAVPVVTNGVVTAIQVTNPGVGYSGPVTVEILGGGGSGAAAGESVMGPNASGGFTKNGAGTLTFSAQNEYHGDTTVNGGTLFLNTSFAVPAGDGRGMLVVNGGATAGGTVELNGYDTTFNAVGGAAGATPGRIVNSYVGSPITLTLGGTVPSAAFGGQIVEGPGAGAITVTKVGAGTQTLGGVNGYTGVTQVTEGTLRVTGSVAASESVNVAGGTFEAAGSQRVKQLFVQTGKATVTGPATGTARTVLTVGTGTNDSPLLVTATGVLDVTTQALVYDHSAALTSGAAVSEIRGHILAGYGAGKDWTGTTGITSSAAAAEASRRAVGYATATEVLGAGGGSFLGNDGVDASSVLVRYTLAGDATLDGTVDFNDLVRLAQNYETTVSSTTQSWWFSGDFTYDGVVDFNDLVKLAQNYETGLPAGAVPGAPAGFDGALAAAFAAVPEPSSALVALAACGLAGLGRRRRAVR